MPILSHQTKNIFYREINPKADKVLVLLHGWNTTGSQSWEVFLKEFENQNVRIIAPDMPGFGDKSKQPGQIWLAKDYANWLNNFLEEIKIQQKIFLMGHSFGGAVASNFTSNFKEKVEKLILVAPAIVRDKKQNLTKIQKITKFGKKIFKLPIISSFYKISRKIWYKLIGSPDYHKTSGIMSKIMQKVIKDDQKEIVKKIQAQTLLCWGTLDTYTPYNEVKIVQNLIPNCQLETFNEINHGIHLHATKKLAKLVTDFIFD